MRVIFYTKSNCHLCDAVQFALLDLRREFDFELDERDIEQDDALRARYGSLIPVVVVEAAPGVPGVELRAPISQIELRRQIKAAAQIQSQTESEQ